jgi:predicted ArsR family transcriptional regulator
LKKGRTSICDEERSGRLSTSRTEKNIQVVERMVQENSRITVDDIAEALNISHGSALFHLARHAKLEQCKNG